MVTPLSRSRAVALALLLGTCWPVSATSQDRSPRLLTAIPRELNEPLSSVSRLVELRDSTVLVHDNRERRLVVLDFETNGARDVARIGAGPLEYRAVNALLRLPGDSILLWDGGNARTLLFTPDARAVRATPLASMGSPGTALGRAIAREADASGRWYAVTRGVVLSNQTMRAADSAALVRIDPGTGRQDTLILIAAPAAPSPAVVDGVVRMRAPGFVPQSAWGVFSDGRVLVIHGDRYQPESIAGDGTRRRRAPIAYEPIPVTASDRQAHIAQVRGMMARASGASGSQSPEVLEPERWQTHMPVLKSEYLRIDSRGRAWAHVSDADATNGERYDLLDANGRRVDAIVFPKGVTLVGMGRGVLYASRADEDGLLFLQRYRLP